MKTLNEVIVEIINGDTTGKLGRRYAKTMEGNADVGILISIIKDEMTVEFFHDNNFTEEDFKKAFNNIKNSIVVTTKA